LNESISNIMPSSDFECALSRPRKAKKKFKSALSPPTVTANTSFAIRDVLGDELLAFMAPGNLGSEVVKQFAVIREAVTPISMSSHAFISAPLVRLLYQTPWLG
jgi:hypothetical protein